MDQLHVSMRAAMRPADASRAADVRTRRVEEGARIVAVPGAVDVVLQMPRGNPRDGGAEISRARGVRGVGRRTIRRRRRARRQTPSRPQPPRRLQVAEVPHQGGGVREGRARPGRRRGNHRKSPRRRRHRPGRGLRASSEAEGWRVESERRRVEARVRRRGNRTRETRGGTSRRRRRRRKRPLGLGPPRPGRVRAPGRFRRRARRFAPPR